MGEEVDKPHQHAFADRHEDETGNCSVHGRDHLQGDPFAPFAKQLLRGGAALQRYAFPVTKQKEQRQQR